MLECHWVKQLTLLEIGCKTDWHIVTWNTRANWVTVHVYNVKYVINIQDIPYSLLFCSVYASSWHGVRHRPLSLYFLWLFIVTFFFCMKFILSAVYVHDITVRPWLGDVMQWRWTKMVFWRYFSTFISRKCKNKLLHNFILLSITDSGCWCPFAFPTWWVYVLCQGLLGSPCTPYRACT